MKPTVCVVVPVYKAEHTIDRCVASILAQDVPGGVSCVLVDDGSRTIPACCAMPGRPKAAG